MKKIICTSLLCLGLNPGAFGALFFEGTFSTDLQNGGVIPDGTLDGWTDTRSVTGDTLEQITRVQVSLIFSGGYNGDLYAYLSHAGQTLVLLNRAGVSVSTPLGYDDPGMNVTLADNASVNIHAYGGGNVPTGTYKPDGQPFHPVDEQHLLDANGGSLTFASTFNGLDPRGSWTLFFADVVQSDGSATTLASWGLNIEVVPEPTHIALAVFGGLVALRLGWDRWLRRNQHESPDGKAAQRS